MEGSQQDVLFLLELEQGHAQERALAQVERRLTFPAHGRGDGVLLRLSCQRGKIFDPQGNPRLRVHDLHRAAMHFDEARAQAVVSRDELLERMFQRVAVEVTSQTHGPSHVIGTARVLESVQEPQSLLGKRDGA
jgi:hypothetical protein